MGDLNNVKALQCTGANKLELVRFPKPVPAEDCALLKVNYCGICGSDLHGIEGKRSINFPFIPGHEIAAVVDSVGKNAGKAIKTFGGTEFKAGDRVTINPRVTCGKCFYCKNYPSSQELCLNAISSTGIGSSVSPYLFGGWAEYIYVIPGSEIILLPDSLTDEIAALAEPFTCVVGVVDRYRKDHAWTSGDSFAINDTVVVYGVGAIGMLMVAGFHLAGAKQIVAIDTDKSRLELSREFGATHTIDITSTSESERNAMIKEMTSGLGAGVVVEACGVPKTITEGVKVLRRGGKLFEVGHAFDAGMAEIDPFHVCRNEIEILGYYAYPSSNSMLYAVKLLDEHKLPYEKLIQSFNLEDYENVIFKKKVKGAIKPVFKLI